MIDSMVCKPGLRALTAFLALTLAACASTSKPVNQEVALRVSEGGERIEASCEVSNDRASWSVVAPVTFGVTRSEQPLTVECSTADGSSATRVFDAIKYSELPGGGSASYSYPPALELELVRGGRTRTVQAGFAQIDDVGGLPKVSEDGREGYRRFLAGDSPRAFAISDKGRWVRVNAVRGAARLAMSRCQSYGGRCRLYAVDDQVVWNQKRASEQVAAN